MPAPTFEIVPSTQYGHFHLLRSQTEQNGAVVRTTILYTSNAERVAMLAAQFIGATYAKV